MTSNSFEGSFVKVQTIEERLKNYLANYYTLQKTANIYHPSAIETYKDAQRASDGRKYLGSPLVSSVRNPMAMRALHQLRLVINELIKNEIIDENTKINIETSRGLLNANERKGLQTWQRERENKRKEYTEKIATHYKEQGYNTIPNNDDILKYQLWEEQNHKCIYTGKEIALSEFLGANPSYDIEHTIPRSVSFDNSQENKTLCYSRFNREVKGNKIPFELSNYDEIKERIKEWEKKYIEPLNKQIEAAVKSARGATDKNAKDNAIQRRHKLSYERNYWRKKYNRFLMEDVPEGFKNSQLVDTGIITKYSRLYLKSLFQKVYTVKGNIVADFRKMWGLQSLYEKKERINHVHHCIDAIVIACISKENYEMLAKYYHDKDDVYERFTDKNSLIKKPWNTFTEDILDVENEIFVSHHTPDVLKKQSRKILRKQGKKNKNTNGQFIYQQGDTVRGSLHKETFYGAIERTELNKKGEEEKVIKYVVRKPLESIEDANLKNIVDEKVREIVIEARKAEKILKKDIEQLEKELKKAEEHEEQGIKEKIAELKNRIAALYAMPNKNGNPIPIKKVRLYQPTVTNPIHLKKHRDKSQKKPKPHKEQYHVVNDSNYLMAIYEIKDDKGNIVRDFEIRNNLDSGEYYKLSTKKYLSSQISNMYEGLIPKYKIKGKLEIPLRTIVKIGTLVIFWQNKAEEIWDIDKNQLVKRLYKVTKLKKDGRITFKMHNEARNDEMLKSDYEIEHGEKPPKTLTNGESYVDFNRPFPKLMLSPLKFNMIVEGYDFKLTTLGKIVPI